jgi:hypothetical protein
MNLTSNEMQSQLPIPPISFDVSLRPGKILHSLIFFTILFPFIPTIIPSTDTQPTFFLLFLLSVFYVLVYPKHLHNYYHLNYSKVYLIFSLVGIILVSVLFARFHIDSPTIWTRIISFLQFAAAIFFTYNTRYFLKEKDIRTTALIFAFFSIIFFLSQGLVERILIPGRTDSFELLQKTGRGARTLSPEPSFFALHMLNLYLIYCLIVGSEFKKRSGALVFWTVSFCLLMSLSGYGFVIFLMLLVLRYTKISMMFLVFIMVSSTYIVEYLESFQSFRGFKLLAKLLADNPTILLEDKSFSGRLGSFLTYMENIKDNFIFGDGFTLFQGGGFISVVSSLGILAFIFFIFFIYKLFAKRIPGKLKALLVFWFLINLFSGPIGIAPLGVIIGLVLRKDINFQGNQTKL